MLLLRIFSITLTYHFAFLVVSGVMLSLAAPGAIVYSFPRLFPAARTQRICSLAMGAGGLLLLTILSLYLAVRLDVASPHPGEWLRVDGRRNLLITAFIWLLPPLATGFVPALLMSRFPLKAPTVYAYDLLGAAVGGIAYFAILSVTSAVTGLLLTAALLTGSAACFTNRQHIVRWLALGGGGAIALFAILNAMLGHNAPVRIRYAKYYKEPKPLIEHWTPLSRITVFNRDDIMPLRAETGFGWGMSRNWTAPPPQELWMEQDASAGTPITRWDGVTTKSLEHILWDITSVVYWIRPPRSAWVLGFGGGRDALAALISGADSVTGVELSPASVRVVRDELADFTGFKKCPNLQVITGEGRTTLAKHNPQTDLIQVSLVDSQAATAGGGLVLAENLLYTREAFEIYMRCLSPGGVISISWYYVGEPPALLMRMLDAGARALRTRGIRDVEPHILLFRNGFVATFLLSPQPWSDTERNNAIAMCQQLGFEFLIGDRRGTTQVWRTFLSDPELFQANQPLLVTAATDDNPFVFQLERWGTNPALVSKIHSFSLVGTRILKPLLWMMLALSGVLIILPLLVRALVSRGTNAESFSYMGVFCTLLITAGCGVGYVLLEIALMHVGLRITGHPLYPIGIILTTLLAGSGLGAFLAGRVHSGRLAICMILVAVVVCLGAAMAGFIPDWITRSRTEFSWLASVAMSAALSLALG
ncbi:MAG: hypothetical protein N2111_04950, partial [Candidatus Sumerlaeaceae bacterium]|nr:hypothetical protein [Candidatus Sumerlaeaceae bacterium]